MDHRVKTTTKVTGSVELEFESGEEVDEVIEALEFAKAKLPSAALGHAAENLIYSLKSLASFMYRSERGIDIDSRRNE